MSKLSEQMLQEHQEEFMLELSFQEWLMKNQREPSGTELDEMEQDFTAKSYFVKNRIITHIALNNIDYNPRYGA